MAPWIVGLAAAGASCGGGQTRGHPFETAWHDESGRELAAFVESWKIPKPLPPPPLAVGSDDVSLFGMKIGAKPWRFERVIEGPPFIAGDLVIAMGGGFVFALDGTSGELTWQLYGAGSLRGAADDGTTTLVSIASLSEKRSTVLAVLRDGTVVRQIFDEQSIGVPVVLDDHAFLPYAGNSVIVFDLIRGREAARIPSSTPVTRAFVAGGELYFGDVEAVRLDRAIVEARRGGGSRVRLPERFLPRSPRWAPVQGAIFEAKPFLLARPAPTALGLEHLALVDDRFVVGLRPHDGKTRWVHRGEHRWVAGSATPRGFVTCDASGNISWFDGVSGALVGRASLGAPLGHCDVRADAAATPSPSAEREPLWRQLLIGAGEPTVAAVDLQLMFIDDLARDPTADATTALLELASARVRGEPAAFAQARTRLREYAREKIAIRRSSREPLILALQRDGNDPDLVPDGLPIGAIAQAFDAEDELARRAVGALAPFVNDPSLSDADQSNVVAQVARHASSNERNALVSFATRERCLDPSPERRRAIAQVAAALIRLGEREIAVRLLGQCPPASLH